MGDLDLDRLHRVAARPGVVPGEGTTTFVAETVAGHLDLEPDADVVVVVPTAERVRDTADKVRAALYRRGQFEFSVSAPYGRFEVALPTGARVRVLPATQPERLRGLHGHTLLTDPPDLIESLP